jgi:twitching motility protein PilI
MTAEIIDNTQHIEKVFTVTADVLTEDITSEVEIRFGYRIGYFHFILDKSMVTEIVIDPVIYSIPNSPIWLSGMLNLRGNILPVIDLSKELNTSLKSKPGKFVLVIDKGETALSILVDALPKSLENTTEAQSLDKVMNISNDYLSPGLISEDKQWMQVDIKSLIKAMKNEDQVRK